MRAPGLLLTPGRKLPFFQGKASDDRELRGAQSQATLCPKQQRGDDAEAEPHHVFSPLLLGLLARLIRAQGNDDVDFICGHEWHYLVLSIDANNIIIISKIQGL
jgi:hypothetical protein